MQYDSLTLDGKQLLGGKLPGFHKMWYNACHAAKNTGGSFKGMSMSCQVGEFCSCAVLRHCWQLRSVPGSPPALSIASSLRYWCNRRLYPNRSSTILTQHVCTAVYMCSPACNRMMSFAAVSSTLACGAAG